MIWQAEWINQTAIWQVGLKFGLLIMKKMISTLCRKTKQTRKQNKTHIK